MGFRLCLAEEASALHAALFLLFTLPIGRSCSVGADAVLDQKPSESALIAVVTSDSDAGQNVFACHGGGLQKTQAPRETLVFLLLLEEPPG